MKTFFSLPKKAHTTPFSPKNQLPQTITAYASEKLNMTGYKIFFSFFYLQKKEQPYTIYNLKSSKHVFFLP
jgi:hypothetical protein